MRRGEIHILVGTDHPLSKDELTLLESELKEAVARFTIGVESGMIAKLAENIKIVEGVLNRDDCKDCPMEDTISCLENQEPKVIALNAEIDDLVA